mgnify:CR=1 FL=1
MWTLYSRVHLPSRSAPFSFCNRLFFFPNYFQLKHTGGQEDKKERKLHSILIMNLSEFSTSFSTAPPQQTTYSLRAKKYRLNRFLNGYYPTRKTFLTLIFLPFSRGILESCRKTPLFAFRFSLFFFFFFLFSCPTCR